MKSSKKLAINGGSKSRVNELPDWPVRDDRELQAVEKVIQSGNWWRIGGNSVFEFESNFAEYHNTKYAVSVANGTQALQIALLSLGIGEGDEVIVPAFTWISTASAVLLCRAIPVLVDVNRETYNIDPSAVEAAITSRTRAIIPVHMAGLPVDMGALIHVAKKHKLHIVEDAAHAHGAEWRGQRVGAIAENGAGIFSFQQFKLMTAGEGGMILTNDEEVARNCFLYSNCGREAADKDYQHHVLGTNSRLSELQASVLNIQLQRLDDQILIRQRNALLLDKLLDSVVGITPQAQDDGVSRNPHYMYMFRYNSSEFSELPRRRFVDALVAEGFPAFVAYLPIHQTPMFQKGDFTPMWKRDDSRLPDYAAVRCPNSELIGNSVVWIHHRFLLGGEDDLLELVNAIEKIKENVDELL